MTNNPINIAPIECLARENGKYQNWKVIELKSDLIGKCWNWKVLELESV